MIAATNCVLSGEIKQNLEVWATQKEAVRLIRRRSRCVMMWPLVQGKVLGCIVIKTAQVFQRCSIAELVLLLWRVHTHTRTHKKTSFDPKYTTAEVYYFISIRLKSVYTMSKNESEKVKKKK